MEYYRIIQETAEWNVLLPSFPAFSRIWGEEGPMLVEGKVENPKKSIRFLPFYHGNSWSGAFLISKRMGEIWKACQMGGRYRPCVLGHVETRRVEPYYFMYPKLLEGLHPSTRYLADGEIESICLCKERIRFQKVFGVKGKCQTYLIVAGDVLEEVLGNGILGFQVSCVEVKEGVSWKSDT